MALGGGLGGVRVPVFGCEEADGEGVGGGKAGSVEADADFTLYRGHFLRSSNCGVGNLYVSKGLMELLAV